MKLSIKKKSLRKFNETSLCVNQRMSADDEGEGKLVTEVQCDQNTQRSLLYDSLLFESHM